MTRLSRILRENAALLLDFDGPICAVFAGHPALMVASRLRAFVERKGVTVPHRLVGSGDPLQVLRWVGTTHPDLTPQVDECLRAEELAAIQTAVPTTGATRVIAAARRAGIAVAVVSNNAEPAVASYLSRQGLSSEVDVVVGRAYSAPELMKPNPAPVLKAIAALDVSPCACVLVGDSGSDIEAARAALVRGVGYAKAPERREGLVEAGAVVVVDAMSELSSALEA